MRKKQINTILRNISKIQKNIKKKKITINMYIFELSSINKYFYIAIQKKILNILYKKRLIKIPNLQSQKKVIVLVEQSKIFYP